MELSNTSDPMLQREDENSSLEAEAQKAFIEPESYLHDLTLAATLAFMYAVRGVDIDFRESTELQPELGSLKRSFERLEQCQEGYTVPDESSGNRSNVRRQPKWLWQEQKYRALKRIMEVVMPSK
ncbi:uncharacterized protein CLUP02_18009 [Colletotrichum lupini]|uniref:Uncharacterized protein n=1 Tax=Colletotrichum lupini TaxID=145971 RepID=A0A9Q8SGI9_9PEZI|nr:uncharacterized protein CLUP02_18009 [Colletotrichum lupini]UQC76496.1 hypothetical protein CLUP02_18009 [Colletotrichum lupini]